MKQVSEMPTSGQFVAVYQVSGFDFISIEHLKWSGHELLARLDLYDSERDADYQMWEDADAENYTYHNATYFIAD